VVIISNKHLEIRFEKVTSTTIKPHWFAKVMIMILIIFPAIVGV